MEDEKYIEIKADDFFRCASITSNSNDWKIELPTGEYLIFYSDGEIRWLTPYGSTVRNY